MRVAVIVILAVTMLFIFPVQFSQPLAAQDEEPPTDDPAPVGTETAIDSGADEEEDEDATSDVVLTGSAARAVVSGNPDHEAPLIYFTRIYTLVPATGDSPLEIVFGYGIETSSSEKLVNAAAEPTNAEDDEPTSGHDPSATDATDAIEQPTPEETAASTGEVTAATATAEVALEEISSETLTESPPETQMPTELPTSTPTAVPTVTSTPTEPPTSTATETPTTAPTTTPTSTPTSTPTEVPSDTPVPSGIPTEIPGETPESVPTDVLANDPVLITVESKVSLLPPTTPIVIEMAPKVLPTDVAEAIADATTSDVVSESVSETASAATVSAAISETAISETVTTQTVPVETAMTMAAATVEPTAQPVDEQKSTAESTPSPSACAIAEAQIEYPTFYRGSYRFDPITNSITSEDEPLLPPPGDKTVAEDGPITECVETPVAATVTYSPITEHLDFPRVGRAMYYNPGVMERVLSFRLDSGHVSSCEECVGHVALMDRSDLNRKIWLEWESGTVDGPFLVIDVAARHHVEMLLQRHWVVDIDYQTAMRIGMNRPLPVTVWDHSPQ